MMLHIYTENLFWTGRVKHLAKRILGQSNRGPQAVLDGLLRGLDRQGTPYMLNSLAGSFMDVACVLSGPKILAAMIAKKKAGQIKKLIAGPNVVYLPKGPGAVAAAPEVDAYVVPSEQVKLAFAKISPNLAKRLFVWPAGIDENFWKATVKDPAKKILIYKKNAPADLILRAIGLVKQLGFGVEEIEYGRYTPDKYRRSLQAVVAGIFFSATESQGIALAESWAMDVPALVWNPALRHPVLDDLSDSPAPYLTPATGLMWTNLKELENILKSLPESLAACRPRQWVLNNMTDSIAAQNYLNIINQIKK